jgi:hypothetical protein
MPAQATAKSQMQKPAREGPETGRGMLSKAPHCHMLSFAMGGPEGGSLQYVAQHRILGSCTIPVVNAIHIGASFPALCETRWRWANAYFTSGSISGQQKH